MQIKMEALREERSLQSWSIQFLFNLEVTLQRRQGFNTDTSVSLGAERAKNCYLIQKSWGIIIFERAAVIKLYL
jgi:hypothetical protein